MNSYDFKFKQLSQVQVLQFPPFCLPYQSQKSPVKSIFDLSPFKGWPVPFSTSNILKNLGPPPQMLLQNSLTYNDFLCLVETLDRLRTRWSSRNCHGSPYLPNTPQRKQEQVSRCSRSSLRKQHSGRHVSRHILLIIPPFYTILIVYNRYDCNGTPAQNWWIVNGSTKVKLAGTNFCLDAGACMCLFRPVFCSFPSV